MMKFGIEADAVYSLREIAEKELIPGVSGYQVVYQMVTVISEDGKRKPAVETSFDAIKPKYKVRPGSKISGKLSVEGRELIKFIEFHRCEPLILERFPWDDAVDGAKAE